MDIVIGGAIVSWACITLWFMGCDIVKGIRSRKKMAIYPTPKSEWVEHQETKIKFEHLQNWLRITYPQSYIEWNAIWDIERETK